MRLSRIALMSVLTVAGVFGLVAPAWAHTVLEKSSPAQGASLSAAPAEVSLTFREAVTLKADPISVTGPDAAAWTLGEATATGAVVSAPVSAATGPAGAYVLKYTVIADDGDAVSGTVRFTMTAAAGSQAAAVAANPAAATEAAPVQTEGSGLPAWVWVLVIVALIAVAAAAFVVRSRRA